MPTVPHPPEALTDEWVHWLRSRLSGCCVDTDLDLVVQHRVMADDGTEFNWYVRLGGGRVAVAAGRAETPGSDPALVCFTSDRDTARAIAADGASAQRAFLEGRLRIDGDVRLLISARPALDTLAAALAQTASGPLGGRAGRRANPVHTGEAVARAARERSEQERETPRPDATDLHLPAQPLT